MSRARERRGAVIKSGAWFGTQSRYWRVREGEREGAVVRTNGYWKCGVFPHTILNLTFSLTYNAQYFTLLKLDTRKCENPSLLAIIFCIHSLHNLNYVLVFMQIMLAF